MQTSMGLGWERLVSGSWQSPADRSLPELLSMAQRLAALPAYDWDREGMTGSTAWLSVQPGEGVLLLYFFGGGTATFEWYPDLSEAGGGLSGTCTVDSCLEALRRLAVGLSPGEALRAGASEVVPAPDD